MASTNEKSARMTETPCMAHAKMVMYAGRPPSASTATGFPQVHKQEQERVVFDALERD